MRVIWVAARCTVVPAADVTCPAWSTVAAGTTVQRAATQITRTEGLLDDAGRLTAEVQPLLDAYRPILDRLQPILVHLASTTSPTEVDAIVQLVDRLPVLADKLDRDILPVLDTLSTVAPDLRDLLDVSRELNELIGSVPGLGRAKKRIEEEQETDRHYRADEEPASAPHRGSAD